MQYDRLEASLTPDGYFHSTNFAQTVTSALGKHASAVDKLTEDAFTISTT